MIHAKELIKMSLPKRKESMDKILNDLEIKMQVAASNGKVSIVEKLTDDMVGWEDAKKELQNSGYVIKEYKDGDVSINWKLY